MTEPEQRVAERHISDAKAAVIFDATLDLMAEVGYDRLSVDGIAARAGVGKATIYRWWSGKADVVVAALAARRVHNPVDADTGSLRGDLCAAVKDLISLARSEGAVIMGVGATFPMQPELAHAVQNQILPIEQVRFERIIERARARQETAGDVAPLAFEVAPAMIFGRFLHTGAPLDDDFIDSLVDDILLPLLTMKGRRAPQKR